MALFAKAPLEDDFERALHGLGATEHRKAISRAQQLIRSYLEPGERLTFIFCEEIVWYWTLVFTDSRLLFFKTTGGFKLEVGSLTYSCQPQDIGNIAIGPSRASNTYDVLITFRQEPSGILIKTSTSVGARLIANVASALRNERRL